MNIAVNCRFLIDGALEGYGYFTREILKRLTTEHPQHQFHLFFDRPQNALFFPANVKVHVLSPPCRHPLLWKWWFDVSVPKALKKVNADIFLSPDGFCSLKTKVPQCVVIHDLGFIHYGGTYRKLHRFYYKRYTPLFIQKAAAVAAVSQFTKKDIIQHYKTSPDKLCVVYNGIRDLFQPLNSEEKTAVKQQYTSGVEYFLYVGAIHPRKNLVNLLKSFSVFKKRLRSQMKLVLAGRLAWQSNDFLQLMKTYKYRSDVLMTGYVDDVELAKLTASAYALVYPSVFEGFGVPITEAMKCNVPVLTSKGTAMQEIAENAALYFNPHSFSDMADKLMVIYKDESLREQLIKKGSQICSKYSWKLSADLLWQCMMKTVESD